MVMKQANDMESKLMKYIWDNYIELSECEKVVFIGHGTGCQAIMDLVNARDVELKVKAVVQVAGLHSLVRPNPSNKEKLSWFKQVSSFFFYNPFIPIAIISAKTGNAKKKNVCLFIYVCLGIISVIKSTCLPNMWYWRMKRLSGD